MGKTTRNGIINSEIRGMFSQAPVILHDRQEEIKMEWATD
jgi:hypothetical protein